MPRLRRCTTGFVSARLVLATATANYLAHAEPHHAGYLMHPGVLLGQTVPYLSGAALRLSWRAPDAAVPGFILATILLIAAPVLYLPVLWDPAARGGDMVGVAFAFVSLITTDVVLLGSAVGGLYLWVRPRQEGPSRSAIPESARQNLFPPSPWHRLRTR